MLRKYLPNGTVEHRVRASERAMHRALPRRCSDAARADKRECACEFAGAHVGLLSQLAHWTATTRHSLRGGVVTDPLEPLAKILEGCKHLSITSHVRGVSGGHGARCARSGALSHAGVAV
eukprot:scaffold44979_cov31-Tisochrysis_lutea.AAC.3